MCSCARSFARGRHSIITPHERWCASMASHANSLSGASLTSRSRSTRLCCVAALGLASLGGVPPLATTQLFRLNLMIDTRCLQHFSRCTLCLCLFSNVRACGAGIASFILLCADSCSFVCSLYTRACLSFSRIQRTFFLLRSLRLQAHRSLACA